jgi:hypothetical protein
MHADISSSELAKASITIQNDYVGQQHLDAYSHIVEHANKWKAAFDKKVQASKDVVIEYKKGDLVQIRDSKLDFTLATESKLLPRWGAPHRVVDCIQNAYCLRTIQGLSVAGTVSVRCLRRFVPREGTALAHEQLELESKQVGAPDEVMEGLDFEEDQTDQEEGVVEDVVWGEGEDVDGEVFFLCCDESAGTVLQGRGVHGSVALVTE